MNRLVTTNTEGVRDESLPPRRPGAPARILFLSGMLLGFKRYAENLIRFTGPRDDIDAVHVQLAMPLWVRAASATWPLPAGWDFHSLRYLLFSDVVIRRWLQGPFDPARFDLIHVMTQGNALSVPWLRANSRAALAVNIDGTSALDSRDFHYSARARAPFRRLEQRILNASHLVVCRNAWAQRSVIDDFSIPESRTLVARSGIALPARTRWSAPRPPGLPRLVFVGSAWKRKGADRLLRVHQAHFAHRAELHFVGDRHEVDRSARSVVWHGLVPHDTLLADLLPTMDAAVFPSVEDQLPRAAVECAAVGLPLVASRLAGIPELVVDDQTGYTCDVADDESLRAALGRLLADETARDRMGRAARAHVEARFNADSVFPALLDRLRDLALSARAQPERRP